MAIRPSAGAGRRDRHPQATPAAQLGEPGKISGGKFMAGITTEGEGPRGRACIDRLEVAFGASGCQTRRLPRPNGRTTMATPLPRLTLVIGGARSGKSRFAEGLATAHPRPGSTGATAERMTTKDWSTGSPITRARRADGWTTIEAPRDLAGDHWRRMRGRPSCSIDCLDAAAAPTSSLGGGDIEREQTRLLEALASATRACHRRFERSRDGHRAGQRAGTRIPGMPRGASTRRWLSRPTMPS